MRIVWSSQMASETPRYRFWERFSTIGTQSRDTKRIRLEITMSMRKWTIYLRKKKLMPRNWQGIRKVSNEWIRIRSEVKKDKRSKEYENAKGRTIHQSDTFDPWENGEMCWWCDESSDDWWSRQVEDEDYGLYESDSLETRKEPDKNNDIGRKEKVFWQNFMAKVEQTRDIAMRIPLFTFGELTHAEYEVVLVCDERNVGT